jgi:NAD-dependent deacetylase
LTRLQATLAERGDAMFLCTQNVDNLHEKSGARHVHHMHGEVFATRCLACGERFEDADPLSIERPCPFCRAQGGLRPDVVWFGETPHGLELCYAELAVADLFVAIGTSGQVWPAAGFVRQAKAAGAKTMEFNLEPTGAAFDAHRLGPASETVPGWTASFGAI